LTSSGAGNQSYAYHDADDLAQITDASSTLKQAFDDASQLTTISDLHHWHGHELQLRPGQPAHRVPGADAAGSSAITQTHGYDGDGLPQYTQCDRRQSERQRAR
jgi:hypothetical protein